MGEKFRFYGEFPSYKLEMASTQLQNKDHIP